MPASIAGFQDRMDLELEDFPSAEAQVAALADDIAYTNHDIDDGLRAGLFEIEDLGDLPLVGGIMAEVDAHYPGLERPRRIHEIVRRLIDRMVNDLLAETGRRLVTAAPADVAELRGLDRPVVAFSTDTTGALQELSRFLFQRMYRHEKIRLVIAEAKEVVGSLFAHYQAHLDTLPEEWRREAAGLEDADRARLVADYIAGMTDRFALQDYERLFHKRVIH